MSLSMKGCPVEGNFFKAWKSYYEVIKTADPNAKIAGSNDSGIWLWGASRAEILRIIFSSVQTTTVCLTLSLGMSWA